MSNPFHRTSRLKHFLAMVVLLMFTFSFSPLALAQGAFDFTDEDDGTEDSNENSFDFVDETPTPLNLEETFVMPSGNKPINLVFFEPVDATPEKTLDSLTEAMIEQLKDARYGDNDTVKAVPVLQKLDAMSADDRSNCIEDAACLADIGRELGVANIVMGRIYTEFRERPQVTLDLIDVASSTNKNSIYFDTQARLRKQEQDISGALLRLFNIDTGSIDSLLGKAVVEESAPLPLGQMIGGIVVGVVGLGAIGAGIYFGLEANKYDDKVKKAIKANEAIKDLTTGGHYGTVDNQLQAKKDYDKASNYAMIANILYASGAVASVVSVILFLVRSDKDDDLFSGNDLYISPAIQEGGAGIAAGFSF